MVAQTCALLNDREPLTGCGHPDYAQAWAVAHVDAFTVLPEIKASAEEQGHAA